MIAHEWMLNKFGSPPPPLRGLQPETLLTAALSQQSDGEQALAVHAQEALQPTDKAPPPHSTRLCLEFYVTTVDRTNKDPNEIEQPGTHGRIADDWCHSWPQLFMLLDEKLLGGGVNPICHKSNVDERLHQVNYWEAPMTDGVAFNLFIVTCFMPTVTAHSLGFILLHLRTAFSHFFLFDLFTSP